jgi:phosphopantothenoylcysteine decarboxylase/phosphopantothenate--cysteine ligase
VNKGKHVVLGVTGSIAAYKAAELVRMIRACGCEVSVVMTQAATHFIGVLTMQTLSRNPVAIDMFEPTGQWCPEHVALADRADALVIAPCTAGAIARMAQGLADDLLTCIVLATRAPVIIVPAMNDNMLGHPAVQTNLETLKARGVTVVDAVSGELVCGREGKGRMAPLEATMKTLKAVLHLD